MDISNPALEAAHSKRLARVAGWLLALALGALGALYMHQPAESAAEVPRGAIADPLAGRRAAAVAAAQDAAIEEASDDSAGASPAPDSH
jgi:hypothetical protein